MLQASSGLCVWSKRGDDLGQSVSGGARISRSGPGSGGVALPDCIPPNGSLVGLYLCSGIFCRWDTGRSIGARPTTSPSEGTPRSMLRRDNRISGFDQRSSLWGGARGKKNTPNSSEAKADVRGLRRLAGVSPPLPPPSQIGSLRRQGPSAESCGTSAESLGG